MTQFNPGTYWEKRLKKKSGLEGVGYAKLGKPFNKWVYKVRKYVFIKEVKELSTDFTKNSILDIGSGTGFYVDIWKKLGGQHITGCDITAVSVENLRKTFPELTFFQLDIGGNIPEELHNQFDFISCMDVLFHIVEDERFAQAIKNIFLMLKKGGHFIYSDNFLHGKTIRTTHQVSFSMEQLYKFFTDSGFEIIIRKPFMVLTNNPVDSRNPLLKIYWFILEQTLYIFKPLGYILGGLLYPLEIFLVGKLKESPTTEILVARRN